MSKSWFLLQSFQRLVYLSELILWSAGTCVAWLDSFAFDETIRLVHGAIHATEGSLREHWIVCNTCLGVHKFYEVCKGRNLSFRYSYSTGFTAPPVLEREGSKATTLWKLCGWLRIDRKVSFVIAPRHWVRNTENLSRACSSPVLMVGHSLIFFR